MNKYRNNKKNLVLKFASLLIIIMAFAAVVVSFESRFSANFVVTQNVSYTECVEDVKNHAPSKIEINGDGQEVVLYYSNSEGIVTAKKHTNIPDSTTFIQLVQNEIVNNDYTNVKVEKNINSGFLSNVFSTVVPLIVFIVIIFAFLVPIMKKNVKGISTSTNFDVKPVNLEGENFVKFSDVAGLEEEKEKLIEIVDILKSPGKYAKMGIKTPKGVLLTGGPGLGKTMLAKAVACEAGVPFYSVSASEFIEKFVGVGASRMRDLFKEAKKNAPSLVFIDEIDAIGKKRASGNSGGDNELNQTINQLLTEMDGFATRDDVIVMAATNRAEILDPALLRPGRFGRQINVNSPDVNAREEILKVHQKGRPLSSEVDLREIAKDTPGFSGADLEDLLNESALNALKRGQSKIYTEDIKEAIRVVAIGLTKKNRFIKDEDLKITAYHEAGHAIVAKRSKSVTEEVREISIIPRGAAGGYTWSSEPEESMFSSKEGLEEKIVGLLGGRAAEEIQFKSVTTGASNDIERATKIATAMVKVYGMSENVGLACLKQEYPGDSPLGIEMEKEAGKEIQKILSDSYEKAKNILKNDNKLLEKVAEELLKVENMSGRRFMQIVDAYDEENSKISLDK